MGESMGGYEALHLSTILDSVVIASSAQLINNNINVVYHQKINKKVSPPSVENIRELIDKSKNNSSRYVLYSKSEGILTDDKLWDTKMNAGLLINTKNTSLLVVPGDSHIILKNLDLKKLLEEVVSNYQTYFLENKKGSYHLIQNISYLK